MSGSLSSTVGAVNPFRYRGYYYDAETGWYYLNARYYDPNVGRFLSPDTILGANGGLQGYNLFAYCNNNPVMFADPSGNFATAVQNAIQAARDTLQATSFNPQMSLIAAGSVLVTGLLVALFGGDIADIVDDMKAERAAREAKKAAETAAREQAIASSILKEQVSELKEGQCVKIVITTNSGATIAQVASPPMPISEAIRMTKNDLLAGTNIFISNNKNWGIYTPNESDALMYMYWSFGGAIKDHNSFAHSDFMHYHALHHYINYNGVKSNPHAWYELPK